MSVLQIAKLGHPVLRSKAKPMDPEEIASDDNQRFFDDLLETMTVLGGIGLAAPQVLHPYRVIAMDKAVISMDLPDNYKPLDIIINPEWEPLDNEMVTGWEGCLSVDNLRGKVPRYKAIKVKGRNREGDRIELQAGGILPIIVQHEADHLDGILYIDRMPDLKSLTHLREFAEFWTDLSGKPL